MESLNKYSILQPDLHCFPEICALGSTLKSDQKPSQLDLVNSISQATLLIDPPSRQSRWSFFGTKINPSLGDLRTQYNRLKASQVVIDSVPSILIKERDVESEWNVLKQTLTTRSNATVHELKASWLLQQPESKFRAEFMELLRLPLKNVDYFHLKAITSFNKELIERSQMTLSYKQLYDLIEEMRIVIDKEFSFKNDPMPPEFIRAMEDAEKMLDANFLAIVLDPSLWFKTEEIKNQFITTNRAISKHIGNVKLLEYNGIATALSHCLNLRSVEYYVDTTVVSVEEKKQRIAAAIEEIVTQDDEAEISKEDRYQNFKFYIFICNLMTEVFNHKFLEIEQDIEECKESELCDEDVILFCNKINDKMVKELSSLEWPLLNSLEKQWQGHFSDLHQQQMLATLFQLAKALKKYDQLIQLRTHNLSKEKYSFLSRSAARTLIVHYWPTFKKYPTSVSWEMPERIDLCYQFALDWNRAGIEYLLKGQTNETKITIFENILFRLLNDFTSVHSLLLWNWIIELIYKLCPLEERSRLSSYMCPLVSKLLLLNRKYHEQHMLRELVDINVPTPNPIDNNDCINTFIKECEAFRGIAEDFYEKGKFNEFRNCLYSIYDEPLAILLDKSVVAQDWSLIGKSYIESNENITPIIHSLNGDREYAFVSGTINYLLEKKRISGAIKVLSDVSNENRSKLRALCLSSITLEEYKEACYRYIETLPMTIEKQQMQQILLPDQEFGDSEVD